MKKPLLLLLTLLFAARMLCGCTEKDIGRDMDAIKTHLSSYGEEYESFRNSERLAVLRHNATVQELEAWFAFVEKTRAGRPASVDMVYFTDEGDPILLYLHYDGNDYMLVADTTRDHFGTPTVSSVKYSKLVEITEESENGRTMYHAILANKEYESIEELQAVWKWLTTEYPSGFDDVDTEYQPFPYELFRVPTDAE